MFHSVASRFGEAAVERLLLLANHVLAAEPIAVQRLLPHVGRVVGLRFEGWPAMLPPMPARAFRITPAGLFESCDAVAEAIVPDLQIEVDASNPMLAAWQALAGGRPKVVISGDAAFATDLNWIVDNVRWDIEDDLARVVGEAPAHQLGRVARAVAGGLREVASRVGGRVASARDGFGSGSGGTGSSGGSTGGTGPAGGPTAGFPPK